MGFSVNLEFFEGPLDLLLNLVRKNLIEIERVSLSKITSDFLTYIEKSSFLDLNQIAEWLLLAAILLRIKSRWLIPVPEKEEEVETSVITERDEREEFFLQKAKEFLSKAYVNSSEYMLIERENGRRKKGGLKADMLLLSNSFFTLLKRRKTMEAFVQTIPTINYEQIMKRTYSTIEEKEFVTIEDLIEGLSSLEEALVTFFCLLELVKNGRIIVIQEAPFNPIYIWSREAFEHATG